jgi:hypothetical protein
LLESSSGLVLHELLEVVNSKLHAPVVNALPIIRPLNEASSSSVVLDHLAISSQVQD